MLFVKAIDVQKVKKNSVRDAEVPSLLALIQSWYFIIKLLCKYISIVNIKYMHKVLTRTFKKVYIYMESMAQYTS